LNIHLAFLFTVADTDEEVVKELSRSCHELENLEMGKLVEILNNVTHFTSILGHSGYSVENSLKKVIESLQR
jgi:hypothetical protein